MKKFHLFAFIRLYIVRDLLFLNFYSKEFNCLQNEIILLSNDKLFRINQVKYKSCMNRFSVYFWNFHWLESIDLDFAGVFVMLFLVESHSLLSFISIDVSICVFFFTFIWAMSMYYARRKTWPLTQYIISIILLTTSNG